MTMLDPTLAGAIAVKTALLLLIAAIVAAALTKRSSAFRHAIWTGALLLSLLMPVAVLTLPTLDVIPASWQLQATVVAATGEPTAQSLSGIRPLVHRHEAVAGGRDRPPASPAFRATRSAALAVEGPATLLARMGWNARTRVLPVANPPVHARA